MPLPDIPDALELEDPYEETQPEWCTIAISPNLCPSSRNLRGHGALITSWLGEFGFSEDRRGMPGRLWGGGEATPAPQRPGEVELRPSPQLPPATPVSALAMLVNTVLMF